MWSVSKLDENSLLRLATLQLHVATLGHPPVPAADSANYYREYLQARSSTAVTREGWAAAADINIVKLARNVLLTQPASVYLQIYSTIVGINVQKYRPYFYDF